ncbi:lytic polysaccharide monooxygenase [Lacimicrobium alkaliphilum]|uniref:Chitin-binding type-3 domain-containing protein n=1 Tax=Lacimicrobium alkaliphilum TaxID=1526571 RepID=A0ABQ1RAF8_9ALTE|nr:lytic polysaccharide monooxygenase [Lacimicrobium alkaliphilum]GGD60328.1 hypothetical protein GCM10011357_14480 [Lacimicrobium alkaliphilum]
MNLKCLSSPALLAVAGVSLVTFSNQLSAHGYMQVPKARQVFCDEQGGYWWPQDGSRIPNLACRAAFLDSGTYQFVQAIEFSVNVADYLNQAAVEAAVPDGSLCSAGDPQKQGINLPSPHWQRSQVTPNANDEINVRFYASTPHNPSFWKFYLSKPGFDGSTQALSWSDLEHVQDQGNVNVVLAPDGNRYYDMTVNIPANRSGDAILYTRWQREDVVGEGFYNCSDIEIVRDTTPPDDWYSAGYFVRQGQDASPGDTVWFRLFDGNGQELINELVPVTSANAQSWQADLAAKLNSDYPVDIQVGVEDANGNIQFDSTNLLSNEVFTAQASHSFNLSIQPPVGNTAPVVHAPSSLQVPEGESIAVNVHAYDDQQDPLTFSWQVPAPLSYSGSGANITLSADQVSEDTNVTVTVSVSDGQLTTTANIDVQVQNDDSSVPAWDAGTVYVGGDLVSYQGNVYRAKWWTLGQQPDQADVWEAQ